MGWTPEKIKLLRKLWRQNLTASAIAKQLGDVTRNAVIGKVHRLNLPGRRRPGRRPAQTETAKPTPQAKAQQPERIPRTLPPPEGQAVKIFHLRENRCRWPYGEPNHEDFQFCGRLVAPGTSYCLTHLRQAYQAGRPKKKSARSFRS